jgi:hypothetical protein
MHSGGLGVFHSAYGPRFVVFDAVTVPLQESVESVGECLFSCIRNIEDGQAIRREQDNPRSANMFARKVPVVDDRFEVSTVIGIEHDANGPGHTPRLARFVSHVNHLNGLMH